MISGGPLRRHGGSRLCHPSNADFILKLFLRHHSNTLHDNQASIWPEVLFDCGHSWGATWFTVVFSHRFFLFLRFRSWCNVTCGQFPLCVCDSGSHMRRGDSLCFTVYQMFLLSKEKMRKVNDYRLNMLFWRFWSEVFRGCAFDTCNVARVMFIF